jgi:glycosyltransferase involved in cell wall biosynthesis
MFSEATVHVHDMYNLYYLRCDHRFKIHPFSESYEVFLETLESMTLNFYVTFSECYGLLIAESLSLGVPCLAANNSGFFDYNDELRKWLVIEEYDNSEAIYRQAKKVLENRDKISRMGKEYILHLNSIARNKLNTFLED